MILSMPGQAWLFLTTVGVGAVAGLFYDFFRVLRKTAPHGRLAVQLEDLFYWLAVTVLVFYFMLHRNYGEIRLFSLLGMAVGATLYFVTVSYLIVKICVAFIEFIKKVIAAVVRLILLPFRIIIAFLAPYVKKAKRFLQKRLRSVGRYGKIKLRKAARNRAIIRKKV
jgi:spore cortex biosynthesis protein YabQ